MAGTSCAVGYDQYRTALDLIGYDRSGFGGAFQAACSARARVRRLLGDRLDDIPVVETHGTEIIVPSLPPISMKQQIKGFDQDDEGHWRARLACGHYQHVRHDPPLTIREWTQTEEGRSSRIGHELECKKCDENTPPDF